MSPAGTSEGAAMDATKYKSQEDLLRPAQGWHQHTSSQGQRLLSIMTSDFPVIDFAGFDEADEVHRVSIAKQVMFTSRSFGFLIITGHGMQAEFDEMHRTMRDFFRLPTACKDPWPLNVAELLGYGTQETWDVDNMFLCGKPGVVARRQELLPPFWRSRISQIERMKTGCHQIVMRILQCFAIALDMDDREEFSKPHARSADTLEFLRLLRYPAPNDRPTSMEMGSTATWTAPRSDSGSVLLTHERHQRLELQVDRDSWVRVPDETNEGVLLVDLGDALPAWSRRSLRPSKFRWTLEEGKKDDGRFGLIYESIALPHTPDVARFIAPGPTWAGPPKTSGQDSAEREGSAEAGCSP
jgi:isopenicillin N synthase-like dioxygenase